MTDIDTLKLYIKEANNIVFFGGAGVSTESGIPDFRSADGLYNTKDVNFSEHNPEYYLSNTCLRLEPEVFFEFYRQKLDVRNCKPNACHLKLAELEKTGKNITIVTQNIDGLHQKAGSTKVLEVHGTLSKNYCQKCKKLYDMNYIFSASGVPHCDCGDIVRPDVTLYGEQLTDAFDEACKSVADADLMIVAGTSLVVYPAAGLISKFHGEHLVIINLEELSVPLGFNDLFIKGKCGEVFSQL